MVKKLKVYNFLIKFWKTYKKWSRFNR